MFGSPAVFGNRQQVYLYDNQPPANCGNSTYWVTTSHTTMGNSFGSNDSTQWEMGVIYKNTGSGPVLRFFTEYELHNHQPGGSVVYTEFTPAQLGCSGSVIKIGANRYVTLETFFYLGVWGARIDCQDGNGFHQFPTTFVTSVSPAYATGETEAFGGGSLQDVHAIDQHALDSSLTYTPWYGFACIFNNTAMWHPTVAFGGYANTSGSYGC